MQAKNETFRDFFRRTDTLAVCLGVNVQDLPAVLSISRASLFSYRTGKRPLTSKAWRKLEAAEREAGLAPREAPAATTPILREAPAPSPPADSTLPQILTRIESHLGTIEARLAALEKRLKPR